MPTWSTASPRAKPGGPPRPPQRAGGVPTSKTPANSPETGISGREDPLAPEFLSEEGVSLYVHFPFCVSRCRYCDFNAHAWTGQDLERHVDALLREAGARAAGLGPQTVFLGGGTPSLLPPVLLARLLQGLEDRCGFRESACEVTLEANPESFGPATAEAAREGGVTRISIGVQSFQADVLAAFDRAHDAETALAALRTAQEAGFRHLNADLIFGFSGQDPALWESDLERVLGAGPDHVSCYELSFEPGTPLTRLHRAGRFPAEDDLRLKELFERTGELCAARGFARYEVSNFARPGAGCRHNAAIWRSFSLVGIGAGAAGCRNGVRRKNLARPAEYEAAVLAGKDPLAEEERPDPHTLLFEVFLMGLRLVREGVRLARARRISGLDPETVLAGPLDELRAEGLLEETGAGQARALRVTPRGLLFLDSVLTRLLPAPRR